MPTLVNYSGDDDFYAGGSIHRNSMDSSLLFSIGSHLDVYCPPRKRSRISGPYIIRDDTFIQEKQTCIDDVLPDECLFEVLRRLPGGKERSASACVSKKWLMLLSSINNAERATEDVEMTTSEDETDGHLTRCLEGKKATDVRLAAISVGTSNRGGLGKLSIRGNNSTRGVTNLGLSAIARGCPSLRSLSLWNISSVGDEGIYEIASGCPMLEKLDLCQCPMISNMGLIAIAEKCPNLTSVSIESCLNIGNEGLQAIGNLCPKLQSVTIKDCPLVGDHGVGGLLSSANTHLTKVKLQSLNITDLSLAVIGHYGKAITNLILTGLQNVSEKGFWVMGNTQGLQRLASLTITSCRGISEVSLEAIGKGSPNLKQMCVRKCCFTSDNALVAFAKASGSLESLQLEECNRVTQVGVLGALSNCGSKLKSLTLVNCLGIRDMTLDISMISPCNSLRSLSIRNCPGFGSSSLAMVGKFCPQLQHVDLSGLYGITDAGLLPLLEDNEAGLVKVNLSGCLNLSDVAILALARMHGGTLEVLNLDGCRKVTDASLIGVADNCLLLTDLDLSNCAITNYGVGSLSCAEQLNLQVLSLSGCSKVSNKSLPALLKLGQTLVGLNLQHCNSISSSMIDLFGEKLWRCNILS